MDTGIYWILALLFFLAGYKSQSFKSRKDKNILPEVSTVAKENRKEEGFPARKVKKLSPEEVEREVNADEEI